MTETPEVTPLSALRRDCVEHLFGCYGLKVRWLDAGACIPGSFWGPPEAGLVENVLYLRDDTPVHSALHEGCHWICMDEQRRSGLHTDAGGDDAEEAAVCYLQVLLADQLAGYDRDRLWLDMDRWGYSFRLGSAQAWFEGDAEDSRRWLEARDLLSVARRCRLEKRPPE